MLLPLDFSTSQLINAFPFAKLSSNSIDIESSWSHPSKLITSSKITVTVDVYDSTTLNVFTKYAAISR